MRLILLIVACTLVLYFNMKQETFTATKYQKYAVPDKSKLGEQRYLRYLSDINDKFQQEIPKTGPFKGSCDDTINKLAENKALRYAHDKMFNDRSKFGDNIFERDPCVTLANYVCEFTDPNMYLSETANFPPRWTVKTLAKTPLPKHTNLNCFNSTLNCCRRSQNNKLF